MRGDMAKALGRAARPIRFRRRSGGGADRSRRVHPFRDAREDRCRRSPTISRSPKPSARAGAPSRRSSRCACSRAPGRCCSRASPKCRSAGKPLAAAEMVLVRIAYAADLPTPDEVIRDIQSNGAASPAPSAMAARPRAARPRRASIAPRGAPRAALGARAARQRAGAGYLHACAPSAAAPPTLSIASFPALIALANEKRDILMKTALERDVRLVRFEDGKLEIALEPSARKTLVNDLARKLSEWTGKRWMVVVSAEPGAPTVSSQAQAKQERAGAGRARRSAGAGRARALPRRRDRRRDAARRAPAESR